MAKRPVFIPFPHGSTLVKEIDLDFEWHPGFADKQKRKCIRSLHRSAREKGIGKVLEISTKSETNIGKRLSAFNLMVRKEPPMSVESAYQGSKVFENGGPYRDLYEKSSLEAKRDERLRNSGELIGFNLKGEKWPLEPKTAFYDWLYLRALNQYSGLIDKLVDFDGFTDIEFNPDKSVNCQARAVAMGVALRRTDQFEAALRSRESFIHAMKHGSIKDSSGQKRIRETLNLFDLGQPADSESGSQNGVGGIHDSTTEATDKASEQQCSQNKESIRVALPEVMKEIRSEAGLTQEELGERIGKSQSWIAKLESLKRDHRIEAVIDYLGGLGVEIEIVVHTEDGSIALEYGDKTIGED